MRSAKAKRGVTMIEVVVALLLLGIIVPPLLQSFQQSQALTQRQVNQGIGLKIVEGVLNQCQGVEFKLLTNPPKGASLPIQLELPGNRVLKTSIPLAGKPVSGSAAFYVGGTPFKVNLRAEKIFEPTRYGPCPQSFSYANDKCLVATFPCPDNFLLLEGTVEFPSGNQSASVTIKSCRAD